MNSVEQNLQNHGTVAPGLQAPGLACRIMALINELRNVSGQEALSADGDAHHLAKIEALIARNAVVELVLPAFPAKSSNREKTTGILPDLGEVLALEKLERLCQSIEAEYAGGARMVICSDGRVFSDLVQVSEEAVSAYNREIARIIAERGLTHLTTFDLDDVHIGSSDFDAMRRTLVAEHGETVATIRERSLATREGRDMFNGIHRFLFEDLVVLHPEISRTKVRNWSKEVSYEVIQRSNAWSKLVELHFPHAVRLSIHPQAVGSKKIGIQLLASNNQWRTPWHSAVLFDGQRHTLVRRQDAEAMGAVLTHAEGRYAFFVVPHVTVPGGILGADARIQ